MCFAVISRKNVISLHTGFRSAARTPYRKKADSLSGSRGPRPRRGRNRQRDKKIEAGTQNVIMVKANAGPNPVVDYFVAGRTAVEIVRPPHARLVAVLRFHAIGRKACRAVAIGRNRISRARTARTECAGATIESRFAADDISAFTASFP